MIPFAPCTDIRRIVTPDIKAPGDSRLLFIDLADGFQRLGGSALAQVYGQIGNVAPRITSRKLLRRGFEAVQMLIKEGLVLSGHDRSGGGLITCLLEMAFGGNCGIDVDISALGKPLPTLFNEELGLVIEHEESKMKDVNEILRSFGIGRLCHTIGRTKVFRDVEFRQGSKVLLSDSTDDLRKVWEEFSYHMERNQANPVCAEAARRNTCSRRGMRFHLAFHPKPTVFVRSKRPNVAILDATGTNGHVEMARAFEEAGFRSFPVEMSDLKKSRVGLREFRGSVLPGGFADMDVVAAGRGWSSEIKFNPRLRSHFADFRARNDTFLVGVCNGDQAASQLGLVPYRNVPLSRQPRFVRNESRRFEPRFLSVKVLKSPSILFTGMEGSVLGIHVAHGEGQCYWPDRSLMRRAMASNLVPLVFVDDEWRPTERYPFNPNGSPCGITALCSPDGRVTVMMPHPERGFLKWQWSYWPKSWSDIDVSPWLRMFQNARDWCLVTA
jgi:phosphoribosylformylglycinamidine synthase